MYGLIGKQHRFCKLCFPNCLNIRKSTQGDENQLYAHHKLNRTETLIGLFKIWN